MLARFNRLTQRKAFFPLLLLVICGIVYGYQLLNLGFYWDDWEIVFLHHFQDSSAFYSYFLYARPWTSWIYLLMFPLLKMDAARWQLFALLLRWLSLVGFWFTFQEIWRGRKMEIGWITLLLAVYPGFTQHAVALTYTRHFLCYALFAFSLLLNFWALKPTRWRWTFTFTAMMASFAQLMTLEYFFGLELLRPLFLWFILRRQYKESLAKTLKRVFLAWLPYLAVLAAFLYLRFVVYTQISPNPEANAPVELERLRSQPLDEAVKLLTMVFQDALYMLLFTWIDPLQPQTIDLKAKATLFSWAVAALMGFLAFLFLSRLSGKAEEEGSPKDAFYPQALAIGTLGILLGGVPVWITGRQVIGGPWADRFSLAPMFGIAIILVVLVSWFARKPLQISLILGVIFGLAASSQIQTVNKYRLNWDYARSFYWQLAWRAPGIAPDTAVIGTSMPFALVNDLHIGFALNTIYQTRLSSFQAPVWFFRAGGMRDTLIADFVPDQPIHYQYLNVKFDGNTSNSLVVYYPGGESCLQVLSQGYQYRPLLKADEAKLIALSNLSRILPDPSQPATPPTEIYGGEPAHTWCYYYQKADLARQVKDWTQASALLAEAESKGFSPTTPFEAILAIETDAHGGRWDAAGKRTLQISQNDADFQFYLCGFWKRLDEATPTTPEKSTAISTIRKEFACTK